MVLRIFLRVIAQSLCAHCPGTAQTDREHLHIGAVAFIHRFGSSLNEHVHFHVCVVDGVFEEVAGDRAALERLLRYCAHLLPWSAFAKRVLLWCTAVPSSTASPPVTNEVPRSMS
jgi:hypothetical protein